jgi:hypothetical protein
MKMMFKSLSFAAILAVAASPAAFADTMAGFNTTLGGPGVYYSHTTFDGGWTTITTTGTLTDKSTLQLGLEAITRGVAPITPSSNDYTYAPGTGSSAGLATWDFAFSVNTGTDTLSEFTYTITITDDTTGQKASFDPTTLPDDGQANGSGVVCHGTTSSPCPYNGANDGMQNAENLGFSFLQSPGVAPAGFAFNPNASDKYTISLTAAPVLGLTDFTDPSVSIDVLPPAVIPPAVPEPSSLILLGTGLVSAAGTMLRRRRLIA